MDATCGRYRRRAEMRYPGKLDDVQWRLVIRSLVLVEYRAWKWATRCGYATRSDEFRDEILAALMRAAKNYDPSLGSWHSYSRRWLANAARRCRGKREQWDRVRNCPDGVDTNTIGSRSHRDSRKGGSLPRYGCEVPPDTDRVDDRDEVEHAMAGLDDRTRRILHAVFWDGKGYRDVAATEGISTSRVGQILQQSYAAMRGKLTQA